MIDSYSHNLIHVTFQASRDYIIIGLLYAIFEFEICQQAMITFWYILTRTFRLDRLCFDMIFRDRIYCACCPVHRNNLIGKDEQKWTLLLIRSTVIVSYNWAVTRY